MEADSTVPILGFGRTTVSVIRSVGIRCAASMGWTVRADTPLVSLSGLDEYNCFQNEDQIPVYLRVLASDFVRTFQEFQTNIEQRLRFVTLVLL